MNIFRVDLFPCQDHTLFDENNNNDSYAQDTNRTPPSHKVEQWWILINSVDIDRRDARIYMY